MAVIINVACLVRLMIRMCCASCQGVFAWSRGTNVVEFATVIHASWLNLIDAITALYVTGRHINLHNIMVCSKCPLVFCRCVLKMDHHCPWSVPAKGWHNCSDRLTTIIIIWFVLGSTIVWATPTTSILCFFSCILSYSVLGSPWLVSMTSFEPGWVEMSCV